MSLDNEWLSTAQAADYASVSPALLKKLRGTKHGPAYHAPSRRLVRYRKSDIDAWLSASRRSSTFDDRAAEGAAA